MPWLLGVVIGLVTGLFGGIFGIGGATVLIPALVYLANLTQQDRKSVV